MRTVSVVCNKLQERISAARIYPGLSHPYDEPIFFACPKKMDEKKEHPKDAGLAAILHMPPVNL